MRKARPGINLNDEVAGGCVNQKLQSIQDVAAYREQRRKARWEGSPARERVPIAPGWRDGVASALGKGDK